MTLWTDSAWRAGADAWILEHVANLGATPIGDFDQFHVRTWSTVIRLPTTVGDVYFKATAAASHHEVAVAAHLAQLRPDCTVTLHAVDNARGWMLMADAGRSLREVVAEERSLARWLDVLPLYAGVQLDVADDADALIALGVPDLRVAALPAAAEEMFEELPRNERGSLREAIPRIRELCAELARYQVPETIQHDDFHDGQVFVQDDRYVLLDWGDACVTHPFFTMAVTLEGVISWGVDDVAGSVDIAPFRDAYLAPFSVSYRDVDLSAACVIAQRLGWLCRAFNGHRSGNETMDKTLVRLRMFLEGHA